ncbi:hypothetical protein NDU88_008217 [Pleurodeles waltl]|uniref:Uncharacterized protein n=1 Tax=Pleurodeles waltl TaxID=8319 RepID=A0AAV7U3T3_PLEWA|nr:hypothetical protein NDU88_008217 [Pleurodeles waltl]
MVFSGNFMSSDIIAHTIPNDNLQQKEKNIYPLFSLAGAHANPKTANKDNAKSPGQDLMLLGDERSMRAGLGVAINASSEVDNYGLASVQGAKFDGNDLERDPAPSIFSSSRAPVSNRLQASSMEEWMEQILLELRAI